MIMVSGLVTCNTALHVTRGNIFAHTLNFTSTLFRQSWCLDWAPSTPTGSPFSQLKEPMLQLAPSSGKEVDFAIGSIFISQGSSPNSGHGGDNHCSNSLGQVWHFKKEPQHPGWKVPEPFQEPEPHHRHGHSSLCPPPHSHFLHRAPLRLALPQDALRL